MASDREKILAEVVCPQCGKTGLVGDPGLDRVSWSSESNAEPKSRLPMVLCECGHDFPANVDQFALSPDPWFQYLGLLGPESLIHLMDEDVIHPFDLPRTTTATANHIASGTVDMEFHDPSTGAVLFKKTMRVADHPQLLVTPGTMKVHELPNPCDAVLAVTLHCKDPDVASHVHLYSESLRDASGRVDSILIACVVDESGLSQDGPLDIDGYAIVVPQTTARSRWLRLMCEALGQSISGNYEIAILGFAKSTEVFVKEYMDECLIRFHGCPPEVAAKALDHFDRISERLRYLVPLLVNYTLPDEVVQAWEAKVSQPRNKRIAHDPSSKTHQESSTTEPGSAGPPTQIEARQAFEVTYRLIRVVQQMCPFPEGRDFDFWCRPRQYGSATA
jgi:hypothetical protein